MRPPAAVETCEQLIRSGAVLLLLILLLPRTAEQTVGIIVSGMVLCEVFSACALTLLFRRHWQQYPPTETCVSLTRRQMFAIALPVGATSLLGTVLGTANSVLIPAKLVEGGYPLSDAMAEFGVLSGMTLPLLNLPTGFIGALCLVMVPDLARRTARGDRRAAGGFLDRVLSATSLLIAPAMAFLTVAGAPLGQLLFRDPRVGQYMLPLALGTLLGCYQSVLSGALNGLGLQGKAARNAILSDGVQLLFTWGTVARYGLAGFAVGYLLSNFAGMALNLGSVLRAASLKPRLFHWFCRPLLSALFMGIWCNLFFRILLDSGWEVPTAAGVIALLGGILYTAALLAQGISVPDLFRRLRSALRERSLPS